MIDVKSLKGLTQDSRKVKNGYLFAAFPGAKSDGRDYIDAAIKSGAKTILAPAGTKLSEAANDVELITDENPRKAFAKLVAEFYGVQPETIAAVTGTNGKTSVVHFAEQIWAALGVKAESLGTLKGNLTTPDPVALHEKLAELSKNGIEHLALEASSHGLDQYRLDGVKVSVAGFTNLSRDHLDYHETMDAYFMAKSRLFIEVMQEGGTAIINVDDPKGGDLAGICREAGQRVWTVGRNGKQFKLIKTEAKDQFQNVSIDVFNKAYDIAIPLVGEFQIMNALCALGLVMAGQSIDRDKAVQALEVLKPVRGRLEYVSGHPENAAIYVDYAHTPDALKNALKALRPHTKNKLICLFGCGGDRDKGKRPEMGEIASEHADQIIITDDNPRSEDPNVIRQEILSAASGATEIAGRREAIHHATQNLEKGDVLLVAGKGHEQGQVFADHTDPFDDVTEVQNAIQKM